MHWKNKSIFSKSCWKKGYTYAKKKKETGKKVYPIFYYLKIQLKVDLRLKCKT